MPPLTVTSAIVYFVELIFYSFHLSMLILMVVKQRKTFKGPFFNIFRTVLIADLICYFDTAITQKLTFIPFFTELLKNGIYYVTITFNILTYVGALQFFGHLFLALNRFTIIWCPLKHKKIWSKQWYTVFLIILPFIFILSWRIHEPLIFTNSFASFVNSYVTPINYTISTVIYLSTTFLAGLLNFLAFLKFFLRKQNSNALNVNEKNLLFVSLICFISQLLRASYNVGRLFDGGNSDVVAFLTSTLPYLKDIFAWSGSISLMFLSSSTRKAYKSFYFCNTKSQINATNSTTTRMYPKATKNDF